ncbi:hypothetical protein GCM10022631_29980 [Deinococcus rubellus]|uniref:hypothetical protein n=1 Tax=Deinococcus rubellus TaxID=1889240 RepID=UPI0031E6AEE3
MQLPFLLLGTLLLSQPSPSPPPLCRAEAFATPSYVPGTYTPVPGIYDIIIQIRSDLPCGGNGHAFVRMASGRIYPWREILPGQPAVYYGIPWYWAAGWLSASGKIYRLNVRGLNPPWEQP